MGHGVFIGLLGNGGINALLYVYVSCWFNRRRGTALALISSGQYVAGAVWPSAFERGIAMFGWRQTMMSFALVVALAVVPVAILVLRAPYETPQHANSRHPFRYSLFYGQAGERLIGYDNEPGKGDYRHHGKREEPYTFTTPEQLIRDFLTDVRAARRQRP